MKSKSRIIITATCLLAILTAAFFYGGGYAPAGNSAILPAPAGQSWETKSAESSIKYEEPAPGNVSGPFAQAALPGSAPSGNSAVDNAAEKAPVALAVPDPGVEPGQQSVNSPASTASAPSAPVTGSNSEQQLACTMSISCATILNHLDSFDPAKKDLLPADGLILLVREAGFKKGESVFDLLLREAQLHKIHLEYEDNPVYGSAYIEGIGNIYEFDCGELSGWTYKVNGAYPGCGCSQYKLKEGDIVEVVYTCDLGQDVGAVVQGGGR